MDNAGAKFKLNKEQQKIVNQTEGPVLVIAGPGSGKTKTLVDRIVNLVSKGVAPEQILVGTFTEKAAKELITRISNLLLELNISVNLKDMYIGTLHSIFLRFLEENQEYTRLKKNFRLFDQFEQAFCIYRRINEFLAIEDITELIGNYNTSYWSKASSIATRINVVSEEMLDVDKLEASDEAAIRSLAKAYRIYRTILEEENALDFSSIQLEAYELLANQPVVLKRIQERLKYFMVDEYQDTNTIQEKILLLLASEHNNICVVGDDDQGLYRFRGATIRNILEFDSNFPEGQCKHFFLETNYRSHPDIVKFYNGWMHDEKWGFSGTPFRFDKNIVHDKSRSFPQTPTVVKLFSKESSDAYHKEVLRFIRFLQDNHHISDLNQIAFLFRSVRGDKAKALASFLEQNGIKIFSPRSDMFFEREEIKLLLGCLLSIFPQYKEILREGSSILQVYQSWELLFMNKLKEDPKANKFLIAWVIKKQIEHADLKHSTDYGFVSLIYQMLQFPIFSRYLDVSLEMNKSDLRPAYNIGILTNLISKFEYLYNFTILTPNNIEKNLKYLFKYYLRFLFDGGIDEYEDFEETTPSGCISFMTIHQSKGLEFPVTVVGSMNAVPRKSYNDVDVSLQTNYYHKAVFEPFENIKYYDFARLYYTAFSRAQNILVLTGFEHDGPGRLPSAYFERYWNSIPSWDNPSVDIKSLDIEKVKPVNIKHEYSFTSHILLYEGCPRQYEFYKEFQFVEERKGSTLGGSLLHETIEDIHKAVLRGETDLLTDDNISSWFNSNYVVLTKLLHYNLREAQQQAILKQVLRYRDSNAGQWEKIKEAEVDVSLVKEDYILSGKIDLVEGENDTVELVDFKSGDKPDVNTTDPFKRQQLNQYRRQLEIYAYLIEQRTGHKVSRMHLYYPKEDSGNPRISFRYSQHNVEATIESFEEVVHKIESKDFSMKHVRRNEHHCSDCDLRFYCNSTKIKS